MTYQREGGIPPDPANPAGSGVFVDGVWVAADIFEALGVRGGSLRLFQLVLRPLAAWLEATQSFSPHERFTMVVCLPMMGIDMAELQHMAVEQDLTLAVTIQTGEKRSTTVFEGKGRSVDLLIQQHDGPISPSWQGAVQIDWRSVDQTVRCRLVRVLWRDLMRQVPVRSKEDWQPRLVATFVGLDVDVLWPALQWFASAYAGNASWEDALAAFEDYPIAGLRKPPAGLMDRLAAYRPFAFLLNRSPSVRVRP